MPILVCKRVNGNPKPSTQRVVQLDRTDVKVMGEMEDVLIHLSSNDKVCQVINIVVADIPDAYGIFLSRDWSVKLNGYFSSNWSHLWLLYKGSPNQIKILREPHMKYNVAQLEEKNELVDSVLGNYFIELEPGNYQAEEASNTSDAQPDLLRLSQADEIDCKIVSDFWTLFFDGSKTLEGPGASCVLIDPKDNKHFLSCRLEFECTNNTAEYEALV